MLLVDLAIVAIIFSILFVIFGLPMILASRKKDTKPEVETADSLRSKITELEKKREERERLTKEVRISRELAELDTQLEELRKQLAEAESRENAAESR